MSKSPVIDTAKDQVNPYRVRTSTEGVEYKLHPVSAALMDAVTSRIKTPAVPMWHDPETDRDVPNPNHPDYIAAVADADRKRGTAVYDAMVMFGIELIGGLPPDESWLVKLNALKKHGLIDLDGYDLEDAVDKEFLYKRFILATNDVITEVSNVSAMTAADIKAAGAAFQSN